MPIISLPDTLAAFAIEPRGGGRFTAPNIPMPYRRIFGGQLLAQALLIAEASAPGKQVKSLHVGVSARGRSRRAGRVHGRAPSGRPDFREPSTSSPRRASA